MPQTVQILTLAVAFELFLCSAMVVLMDGLWGERVWHAVSGWTFGPGPLSATDTSKPDVVASHEELRRHHLRLGPWAGITCMMPILLDTSMCWPERGTILGLIALSVTCLAYLQRASAVDGSDRWPR